MAQKRETQYGMVPTLSPLFGGPDKKPRALDKEVMTVGRARGCDITLDANEVSAVHCIFFRSDIGYRIRDCGSRTGTRLNGNAVKNAPVANGDVLQIGPFSFEIKLPEGVTGLRVIDQEQHERSQRSRRKLVRLALQLRRRLRLAPVAKPVELTTDGGDGDQRLAQLKQLEQQLHDERDQVQKEQETHRDRLANVEADIARRLAETDQEIHQRWTEFQKRCTTAESQPSAAAVEGSAEGVALEELRQELAKRELRLEEREKERVRKERDIQEDYEALERDRQEMSQIKSKGDTDLAQRHAAMLRQKAAVDQAEAAIRDQKANLMKMVQDLKQMQEELRKQPRGDTKALQQENHALRQTIQQLEQRLADGGDAKLREQLAAAEQANATLTEELRSTREQLANGEPAADKTAPTADVAALRAENDELRQLLQRQLFKPSSAGGDDEELRAENQQLRQILTEYEQRLAADQAAGPPDVQVLRDENELLRQLLQEKDKFVQEIRNAPAPAAVPAEAQEQLEAQEKEIQRLRETAAALEKQLAEQRPEPTDQLPPLPEDMDLDSIEAVLNRERQQIQAERTKLNKEIESLRVRNAELDEATREMEMELSRERADMARERIRLDRMREEIKSELERLQRDGGVRESLVPVQRLRDEMRTAGTRR